MEVINHQFINKKPTEVKNKTNSQLRKYFNIIKQIDKCITKFNKMGIKKLYKN